jgi:myo-inositol-1(or 4)-monophosphatase
MESTLVSALKQAGQIQLESFGNDMNESVKESISSVVTEVDIKSEKAIIEIILSAFPKHNILSEECGYINNHSNYTWVIDPIDGTSNFAAGIPWFGVIIALLDKGLPVMGGSYMPFTNDLYFAELGKGAFLNNNQIHVTNKELKDVLFSFSTDYTNDEVSLNKSISLYRFIIQNSRNVRCTNSVLDYNYVAEGKLGGCINMYSKIWDIAAPYVLIKEAGGIFKGLDFNEIKFELSSEQMFKNYSVLTGNSTIMQFIESNFK